MNRQITLNGKAYDVLDACIHMDRESLTKTKLEEIPENITVLCDGPEEYGDVMGVRNLGKRKAQGLVCFPYSSYYQTVLSDNEYDETVELLISKREHDIGDVEFIYRDDSPDREYCWFEITMETTTIESLIGNGRKIATEIIAPLISLEQDVMNRLDDMVQRSGPEKS